MLFAPDADDLGTALAVEVRDLGTEVLGEDLPDLERGFLRGLRSAEGSRILSRDRYDHGFVIGVEAVQTYLEEGVRRKRWVRVLHKGSLQVRVVARGATVAEYERWRPAFAPCITSFTFGDVWPEAGQVV